MPPRKTTQISEAESVVMKVIWEKGAVTSEEIVAALAHRTQWQEPTIKTLLNRLLKKGAVRAIKDVRRYVYSPILTHEQWLGEESSGFLDRLFEGRVAPLVSFFSRNRKLSKKDIADLKRLIEELDDGR